MWNIPEDYPCTNSNVVFTVIVSLSGFLTFSLGKVLGTSIDKNMLKRRKESDTYLATFCRHH